MSGRDPHQVEEQIQIVTFEGTWNSAKSNLCSTILGRPLPETNAETVLYLRLDGGEVGWRGCRMTWIALASITLAVAVGFTVIAFALAVPT